MKKMITGLIRFYQKHLSKLHPPCCRYYTTCSQYALEAFERFGVLKGGYLAAKRLLRCNPLFKGGIDPVPQKFSFLKKKDP